MYVVHFKRKVTKILHRPGIGQFFLIWAPASSQGRMHGKGEKLTQHGLLYLLYGKDCVYIDSFIEYFCAFFIINVLIVLEFEEFKMIL